MKVFSTNGMAKTDRNFSPMRWKSNSNGKHARQDIMQMPDDWHETGTLLAALEKIESWIFSRIVESVWWQVKVALLLHLYCLRNLSMGLLL
jgi:hypothetical protein